MRNSWQMTLLLSLVAFGLLPVSAEESAIGPGAKVAVVGDSITEQKLYSKFIETYLLACSGVPEVKVFQFGWSGETAGGFASRAENDLAVFSPSVVTLCYGMNDGGYQPWRDAIGQGYEGNMRNIVKKLEAIRVKTIVVGSPGAVDTQFFRNGQKMGDLPAHEAYNDNLAHLRDIDRKLATEYKQRFADVHGAMVDSMKKAKAGLGASYDVCGGDGFHPNSNGQLIMAYAFLKSLGLDGNIGEIAIDFKADAKATPGHKVVKYEAGKLELESTRWPFCFYGDGKSSAGNRSITPYLPFNEDLNRLTLRVTGLTSKTAKVTWGKATKEFTSEQLTKGINLTAEFSETPFDGAFDKLTSAVGAKQNFETYMIKSVITNFRSFPEELKKDAELQAGLKVIRDRLGVHQQKFDAAARATLVPVPHTIVVTPGS